MSELDSVWIIVCALFVLKLQCGFLCLEAGAVRSKNSANVAIKNLADICVVGIVYWAFGYAIMFGDSAWGLWGTTGFAPELENGSGHDTATFVFQLAFAATTITIISGAVAERERFAGYITISVVLAAIVYPIGGHWVWNENGWLNAMGFVDFAGATVVHGVGGWAALVAVTVVGPRLGRFGPKKRLFEQHSVAISAFGAMLLWIGWGAFNGGSALLFNDDVGPIVARTMLTAAGGGILSIVFCYAYFGHVQAEAMINGVLGGLVAGTATIHLASGFDAIMIGMLGGLAVHISREVMSYYQIDDVVGAVPVHLCAGIVGTLSVAFFSPVDALPTGSVWVQFAVQGFGICVVGAWVLACTIPVTLALRAFGLLRAHPRDEVRGLNIAQNNQRSALLELLEDMKTHQRSGDFQRRVRVERSSEFGAFAFRYNRVLDRVEDEIDERMEATAQEQSMRAQAERAFKAMQAIEEESAHAARHDILTGLGNRMGMDELCKSPQQTTAGPSLVIAIDLDRFKEVNDTYGHEAGDIVLKGAAARLKARIRSDQDFAFRLGGDEFVLLMNFDKDETVAAALCESLLAELLEPTQYKGVELTVGASIGFAVSQPGENLASTLHRADLALYRSKDDGRSRISAFTDALAEEHDEKIRLMRDFKKSLDNDEIQIVLQPQIETATGALIGAETLVRWRHPVRGIVGPDVLLPVAIETNMMADVDRRVLDLALEARQRLQACGIDLPSISVNVSSERLLRPGLISELRARHDLPPSGLAFEFLETVFLDDVSGDLNEQIDDLRNMGIRIELDDFGTGHASIASVLALKPDRIKIDRMFTQNIDENENQREFMRALLDMAAKAGAEAVVEGVETMGEMAVLRQLGADVLQGYYFSRPLPLDAFIDWAQRYATPKSDIAS